MVIRITPNDLESLEKKKIIRTTRDPLFKNVMFYFKELLARLTVLEHNYENLEKENEELYDQVSTLQEDLSDYEDEIKKLKSENQKLKDVIQKTNQLAIDLGMGDGIPGSGDSDDTLDASGGADMISGGHFYNSP
jgi:predicted nuclease with TOPRIM domain